MLVGLGAALAVTTVALHHGQVEPALVWFGVASTAVSALAAAVLHRAPRVASVLGLVAPIAFFVPSASRLAHEPGVTLALGATLLGAAMAIWRSPKTRLAVDPRTAAWRRMRASGAVALASLLVAFIGGVSEVPAAQAFVAFSLVAFLIPLPALWASRHLRVPSDERGWFTVAAQHPARLLVTLFLVLCVVGTVLLSLPAASAHEAVHPRDAAFTAVSAVCVTGLVVLDTPAAWSLFGHITILVLIQLGALGIMSLSGVAFMLLGRRAGLREEGALAGLFSGEDRGSLLQVVRRTLMLTFGIEAIGAVLLVIGFMHAGRLELGQAVWHGVFTAVSAFANAGFALESQSLMPYQHSPFVLHVVSLLIITGGLSPLFLAIVPGWLKGRRVALQHKLAGVTTAALLTLGFVVYLALEWQASLEALTFWDRIHNAWFQSVTLRTAGFNSVDLTTVTRPTLVMMMSLMYIGGSPGGTAGGMKTTTFVVLFLAVVSIVRGQTQAAAFGRRIPHTTVYRAAAIATMGLLALLAGLVTLLTTQPELGSMSALFELVSALATVGLSLGATSLLDEVGKVIIMVCMFLGRVGPLTAFLVLSERSHSSGWAWPEEPVEVG